MSDSKIAMRFRESFRGYNKDDVNLYIEEINNKFARRETELKMQIDALKEESKNLYVEKSSVCSAADNDEINTLKCENNSLKSEIENLKAELEKAKSFRANSAENDEKSKLYDSMSSQVGNILIVAQDNADKIVSNAKAESDRIRSDAIADAEKSKNENIFLYYHINKKNFVFHNTIFYHVKCRMFHCDFINYMLK